MRKSIITLILLLFSLLCYAQQDPLYNQYQFNQQMINPAYAGIYNRMSLSFISRAQWVGIEGAPITQTLTGNTSFRGGKSGVGINLMYDKFGINQNYEVQALYSYILNFGSHKLSMGIQGGVVRYQYDYQKLTLDYLDDPYLNPPGENFTKPNFGAGLMLLNERYFFGLSIPRILNINVEDGSLESTRYKKHYYASGGVVIFPSPFVKLKFTSLLRYMDQAPVSVDLTGSVLLGEAVWTGLSLRNMSALGLFALVEIGDSFRAGYSFELPTNSLVRSSYGTHEISVGVDFSFFSRQLLTRRYF